MDVDTNTTGIDVVMPHSVPASFPASLRRIMMLDISTWAVQSVSITKYSGEEDIQHVAFNLDKLVFKDNTSIGGYDVDGTSNSIKGMIHVEASENGSTQVSAKDVILPYGFEPVDVESTIVTLRRGQVLQAEVNICLYSGRYHEKWSPAVAVSTFREPTITLNHDIVKSQITLMHLQEENITSIPPAIFRGLVAACPTSVFSWNGDIEDIEIDASRCIMCKQCENVYGEPLGVEVSPYNMDKPMEIHVESNGTMTPTELFIESVQRLKSLCESLPDE